MEPIGRRAGAVILVAGERAHPKVSIRVRGWWWIAATFLVVQIFIACLAANGPFVDEGLYTVAGMRVLDGKGLSDGYIAWFNGSPFAWPVLAAVGHRLGGLTGARLVAVAISIITLVGFARTAETLFGESAAAWATAMLSLNGLFIALAHFAVYDVPALAAIAVAMWSGARFSISREVRPLIVAAVAFALAVICKYGYVLLAFPILGLLVSRSDLRHLGRSAALFCLVAGGIVSGYFLAFFGSPVPSSMIAYLDQTFQRSRGHIAMLQVVFGFVPFSLAAAGGVVAWRNGRRMLTVTCLAAMAVYPAFHLWTANFVSGQKHVVPGFLFGYLLAGVALERLWKAGGRVTASGTLALALGWGGVQWYWQEHSWSDTRALTSHLVGEMRRGERVIAESSWIYTLALYPAGLIDSPADVIDANFSASIDRLDPCRITWLVGDLQTAESVRRGMERCGHRPAALSRSRHYYFDTSRMRLDAFSTAVTLYRLPARTSGGRGVDDGRPPPR